MKAKLRFVLIFIVASLSVLISSASGQLQIKEFNQYNCRLRLPDEAWQWNDEQDIPQAIAFAQSEDGIIMLLIAMHQGKDALINAEFIKGFEEGAISPENRKIDGHKLTFQGVPCYQLETRLTQSELNGYTRVFFGNKICYSFQFLIPHSVEVNAEKLNYLFDAFAFITTPKLEYADDMENSQAYRMGQLVGKITFWVLIIGVGIIVYRKLRRIRIGKQR